VKRINRLAVVSAAVLMGTGVLGACSTNTATSSDMCAYTVGTGQNGADAKVHEVYLPNEQFKTSPEEDAYFFPCNPRNIRLTNGSTDVLADGKPVGPVEAYTKNGTKVIVDVRMDWSLNQNKDVLKNVFIPWCKKYECASGDPNVRNDNFSTPGWSKGFLGENATPAFITSTRNVIHGFGDEAWNDTVSVQDQLNSKISEAFMKSVRGTFGSDKDLFCGSGLTSSWSGGEAGSGTFDCSAVRITVENVQPADKDLLDLKARQAKAAAEAATNQAELDAAKKKYGDNASQVLGDLDKIKQCAQSSKECNVYVGTSPNTK
jgi:hypothetical protein